MKFLWQYLRRYRKLLVIALVLAAINQIFSLLDPYIFRLVVDDFGQRAGEYTTHDYLRGVGLLLAASVGVALVSRTAKALQDYTVNVITQRAGTQLYASSVAHSFSLPYQVFEDQRSGELLQKLQKARTDTQAFIDSMINVAFFSLIGIVFVIIYAFTAHWQVGVVYFLIIPVLSVITFLISRGVKDAQERVVKESASLAGSTTETIRNVELVKSLGLEQQEIDRLNTLNDKILGLELKKIILIRRLSFIQGTIVNALRSGLLLLMFWLIFKGEISLGEMLSLYIYSFFIFSPLAELGRVAQQYQEARASLGMLDEIMKQQPEPQPENAVALDSVKHVEFRGVTFQHASSGSPAVVDASFEFHSGETVAFVGPSGSGKTTIMKLLVGLYRAKSGEVMINGEAMSRLDPAAFRRRIGLVSQDTQLFAGTIKENLLFVRPDATDDECREVLSAASATNLLERATNGLDTKIGEGGIKISGGEKQRLAIARALLRRPDLIIFDEATSSLDSITEQAITETIHNIERQQTHLIRVLVAHRLSTVVQADRIYVLEKGRVVESGTHTQLLDRGGLYSALWRQQSASGESVAT